MKRTCCPRQPRFVPHGITRPLRLERQERRDTRGDCFPPAKKENTVFTSLSDFALTCTPREPVLICYMSVFFILYTYCMCVFEGVFVYSKNVLACTSTGIISDILMKAKQLEMFLSRGIYVLNSNTTRMIALALLGITPLTHTQAITGVP